MAVEVREWAISIVMIGGMAVGIWLLYDFAKGQGWISFRPRLARMKAGR